MLNKILISLWSLLVVGILSVFGLFYAVAQGWLGYLPNIDELDNPSYKFASQIISADGVPMGTWSYSKENRVYVDYDDIAPKLIEALVATEDVRFHNHSGIDARALLRAIIKRGILQRESAGGGSTITQQLAKLLYSEVAGSKLERLSQKPIEWVIAVQLERRYTKEEIITMYLNKYDFGYNAVGIMSAANVYFGKHPRDLSIEEAAMLVGMCKNSSLYNPRRRPELTKGRRNIVLSQMQKAGYLTKEECSELQESEMKLNFHSADHKAGIATYFREYLRGVMTAKKPVRKNYRGWQMQQYYEDSIDWATNPLFGWCNKNVKADGSNYNVYTDGLKIYTTIDSRMQKYLEEAVQEHVANDLQPRFFKAKKGQKTAPFTDELTTEEVDKIMMRAMKQSDRYRIMKKNGASEQEIIDAFNTKEDMQVFSYKGMIDTVMTPLDSLRYYKYFLRAGVYSMDPHTGAVKAYVGGPNFFYFKYDMANVGRRQVGSTIKPYLYSLAMENGFSPCDETRNVEQTLVTEDGKIWSPKNTSKARYGEVVDLRWGLANSNNWISAYLMGKLNPYTFKKLLHQFGLRNRDIEPALSLCLGTCDASVGEMVAAYTAFIGKGIRTSPIYVTRIEDNQGNTVATFTAEKTEVISEESSYKMIEMLRSVIDEGTGGRIRRVYNITADMGGKTGTTQNNSDGWFMGFTPSLVTGCWVGGEERDIHFDRMSDGQGASMALPIWGLYMNKVYADKTLPYSQDEKFDIPFGWDPCLGQIFETTETGDTIAVAEPTAPASVQISEGFDDLFQ